MISELLKATTYRPVRNPDNHRHAQRDHQRLQARPFADLGVPRFGAELGVPGGKGLPGGG